MGEAAITGAGNLKAKWVIHAASMALGGWTTKESLLAATQNALKRAEEKKVKTIAFPAIGTGAAGFPLDKCAQIMLRTVKEHLEGQSCIQKVYFVLFNEKAFDSFKREYERLE
jgi:O-acetyl-ADP-ribose deacetylase (regulator of RNase III)